MWHAVMVAPRTMSEVEWRFGRQFGRRNCRTFSAWASTSAGQRVRGVETVSKLEVLAKVCDASSEDLKMSRAIRCGCRRVS